MVDVHDRADDVRVGVVHVHGEAAPFEVYAGSVRRREHQVFPRPLLELGFEPIDHLLSETLDFWGAIQERWPRGALDE